ncbi:hypothetical protein HA052_11060 [Chromobacterium haemolyticum]|uniref:Uncharacterized protein n=1 Tax=Chromobacterium fluminis TaxID=3044269 RepID=A0ABX0L1P8_9NEIS|nr:hypothetical protein [Chromobacterium haemolyticum]NHR05739.1 hypothetical protein [Chromobacterium haemolyticum]
MTVMTKQDQNEIEGDMQFSTIRALVGWAFQMSEAIPVKVQKFAEAAPREFDALTPDELKMLAVDILAKVARLPAREQQVLAAYFTADTRAVIEAARLLPGGWPTALRRELTRGWVNEQEMARSQEDMGQTYMLSQPTICRRQHEAFRILSGTFSTALAVIEVQVLDLVKHATYRNAKRSKAFHSNTCVAT